MTLEKTIKRFPQLDNGKVPKKQTKGMKLADIICGYTNSMWGKGVKKTKDFADVISKCLLTW